MRRRPGSDKVIACIEDPVVIYKIPVHHLRCRHESLRSITRPFHVTTAADTPPASPRSMS